MDTDSEYYGLYALKNLLEWPALHLVLLRRKQTALRRTVVFSGAAQTGKTIALQLLPNRLPEFKILLVTLPQQKAPGRKITWRPFLLSILESQSQPSKTRGTRALLEEVLNSLGQYDLLILDQAERFSLQYLSNLCTLLSISRCAALIVGQKNFGRSCGILIRIGYLPNLLKIRRNWTKTTCGIAGNGAYSLPLKLFPERVLGRRPGRIVPWPKMARDILNRERWHALCVLPAQTPGMN